jgi:hypothetical protein
MINKIIIHLIHLIHLIFHIKLKDYLLYFAFSYVLIFLILNFALYSLSNLGLSLLQGINPSDYCNCFSPHS